MNNLDQNLYAGPTDTSPPYYSRAMDLRQAVFSVANHKGGVFKTGLTLIFAQSIVWLRENAPELLPERFREGNILLVDSDPQGNLTEAMGFDPVEISKNIKDFLEDVTPERTLRLADEYGILETPFRDVSIIPSSLQAESYIYELHSALDGIARLKKTLQNLAERFPLVIIDTPPNLQYYTKAAIVASNFIFMPITPSRHAALGITPMRGLVSQALSVRGDEFPILLGCVYNGLDRRIRDHYSMYVYLRQALGSFLFDVRLPTNSRLAENINRHKSVFSQTSQEQKNVLLALTSEIFFRAGFLTPEQFSRNLKALDFELKELVHTKD